MTAPGRAAKLGCSSNLTALRSASASSLSTGMDGFSHDCQPLPTCILVAGLS